MSRHTFPSLRRLATATRTMSVRSDMVGVVMSSHAKLKTETGWSIFRSVGQLFRVKTAYIPIQSRQRWESAGEGVSQIEPGLSIRGYMLSYKNPYPSLNNKPQWLINILYLGHLGKGMLLPKRDTELANSTPEHLFFTASSAFWYFNFFYRFGV